MESTYKPVLSTLRAPHTVLACYSFLLCLRCEMVASSGIEGRSSISRMPPLSSTDQVGVSPGLQVLRVLEAEWASPEAACLPAGVMGVPSCLTPSGPRGLLSPGRAWAPTQEELGPHPLPHPFWASAGVSVGAGSGGQPPARGGQGLDPEEMQEFRRRVEEEGIETSSGAGRSDGGGAR